MWFRTIFRRKPAPAPDEEAPADLAGISLPGPLFTQLNRLRFHTGRQLRGSGAGQRPSTRRRPAADFREHRKYVAGDDVRFVDWKASARSEQVFLKQGEQPQETTIHLLLDTSASMAWGTPSRQITALQLTAALGYLALNGDDRLQLLPLLQSGSNSTPDRLRLKGKGQFPMLWNSLRRLPFTGRSDLLESFRFLSRTSRGGLVLVLSDLLDAGRLDEALALLPRPTWEVALIHLLHPQELEPKLLGDVEMVDAETGRQVNYDINESALAAYRENLSAWRGEIEMACVRHKAFYTLVSSGWSLERETIPHLHRVRVLEPA